MYFILKTRDVSGTTCLPEVKGYASEYRVTLKQTFQLLESKRTD